MNGWFRISAVGVVCIASYVLCVSAHAEVIDIFENQEQMEITNPVINGKSTTNSSQNHDGIVIETSGSVAGQGTIRLRFSRRASSMLVPARVGHHEVYFLFDTGATYTTLTPGFARMAGIYPARNAPSLRVMTANGMALSKLGIMNQLTLGNTPHNHVTFGLCASCGGGEVQGRPIVGLLGLNVLRRYRMNIDDSQGMIQLDPLTDISNRSADIEPWIMMQGNWLRPSIGRRIVIAGQIFNQSPRDIRNVEVSFWCDNPEGATKVATRRWPVLKARAIEDFQEAPTSTLSQCAQFRTELESARW